MRLHDMNWQAVQEYLQHDDRVVIPVGSTEQHGFLSLGTDAILAERVSIEAAEPLGIPVLPVLPFGVTPYLAAFPGSITLRLRTFLSAVEDILDCLEGQGFRRFAIVNGHGGNTSAADLCKEWTAKPRSYRVQAQFLSWYNAPRTWAVAETFESDPGHGSWFENFPWTRIPGVEMPAGRKPALDRRRIAQFTPADVREQSGDGNFGGSYDLGDEAMNEIWKEGVSEVRDMLTDGWAF